MLNLRRIESIRLNTRPQLQIATGYLLLANYRWLPGVDIRLEDEDRIPDEPVIFAMNHTDRYNYFPFQVEIWQQLNRFTATWVKGKYYENALVGKFMEKTNQLPTVSRGYLLTRDFISVMKRTPTDEEYGALRRWVDAQAVGDPDPPKPEPGTIPDAVLSQPRNVLGVGFEPDREDYASYVCATFRTMMQRFVALNEETARHNLDLLIFPQGTRSRRLLPGHIGISQIALHLKRPIVPVGCNGCDQVYPGASPLAKKGRIVYRFGEPISYDKLAPFHVPGSFEPFTAEAERDHRKRFQGVADLLTDRIEELLDEPYRRAHDAGEDAVRGSDRFL